MSVQSWLNEVWYERPAPPWWLVPPSLLYAAVAAARRLAYARGLYRSVHLPCPVVVVGNLSVGGTGKTPLVCWLAANLAGRGYRPGIVTRGYGGTSREPRRISASDDPGEVGDEPILLARRTGVPVAIGRDRPSAARLLADDGCRVIVSDDGLQHYALARDCEIVVIDAERGFGNGRLLPAGPLREAPGRLKGVDAIVVNGGAAEVFGGLRMRLDAGDAVALRGGAVRPLSAWQGTLVHAVAGIGNPERFFNMLRARGVEVDGRPLADHARLTPSDIDFGDDRPVLMTKKDAVKCRAFAGERHWYVPVSAGFDAPDAQALLDVVVGRIDNRGGLSRGSTYE